MGVFSWLKRRRRVPSLGREWVAGYVDERGPVVFVEGAVPGGAVVPEAWRALPSLSPVERVGLMVSVMGETVGEHLPRTLRGLRERCVDAELAVHGGEYFVVYTFFNADGKEVSYVGGNPLRPSWPGPGQDGYADNVRCVRERVPESVRAFYERTHDGFGMFPDADYRLYRLGRVRPVYDVLDPGYEEPEVAERARHCYMFYEDASGAPFTLDILADRVERAGDLWWIDSTREYHVDFWGRLDELLEAVIVPLEDRGPRRDR